MRKSPFSSLEEDAEEQGDIHCGTGNRPGNWGRPLAASGTRDNGRLWEILRKYQPHNTPLGAVGSSTWRRWLSSCRVLWDLQGSLFWTLSLRVFVENGADVGFGECEVHVAKKHGL